jgi:NAD(P)-dependent dehydrogenase (short-subunit alcohol dehydrogenase family)
MQKKIIVLGGSSGIGKAIAIRFATEGWRVMITGVGDEVAISKVAEIELPGERHFSFHLDARDAVQLASFKSFVESNFGKIDAFVNSIGISQQAHSIDSDFDFWDNAVQVMLYGTVKTARILVPLLNNGGRIITITSIHNDRVAAGSSAYGMSKAAIMQYTRAMALELAPRGILVNSIAPGFVETPSSIKADGKNEMETEWFQDNYVKYGHLPLKRAAQPNEIAGVAYFLAGPDATYMTGSVLVVDGGLLTTF